MINTVIRLYNWVRLAEPLTGKDNKMSDKNQNWHQADIKAAIEKAGLNMSQLSRNSGLAEGTLRNVFKLRYPKAQRIIGDAIGVDPKVIWPSRYEDEV